MRDFRKLFGWASGVVIALNVDNALDRFGIGAVLGKVIGSAPEWLAHAHAVLLGKWVLAGSSVVLGLIVGDWIVRSSLRWGSEPGRMPLRWVEHRRRMLLLALRHPRTFGRLLDAQFELATLDEALQASHIGFAPLPCLDPDAAEIGETIEYLAAIGPLRSDRLPRARRVAEALSPPLAPASETALGPVPKRPGRLRSALLALIDDR